MLSSISNLLREPHNHRHQEVVRFSMHFLLILFFVESLVVAMAAQLFASITVRIGETTYYGDRDVNRVCLWTTD